MNDLRGDFILENLSDWTLLGSILRQREAHQFDLWVSVSSVFFFRFDSRSPIFVSGLSLGNRILHGLV